MSGYANGKFGLTATKMQYWHRSFKHPTPEAASACPICSYEYGKMQPVADYLQKNGFKILAVGNAHINIKAESAPYFSRGGKTTKEVDGLYKLLAYGNIQGCTYRVEI